MDTLTSLSLSFGSFCVVVAFIVLLGDLLSAACAMGDMFGFQRCFGQMVRVKWFPHQDQDQGFHSKTLH